MKNLIGHIYILSIRASLNIEDLANPFKTSFKSSSSLGMVAHDFLNKTIFSFFFLIQDSNNCWYFKVFFSFNIKYCSYCYFLTSHLFRSSGFPHPLMKSLVRRSFLYKTSNLLTPISSKLTSRKKTDKNRTVKGVNLSSKFIDCNTK